MIDLSSFKRQLLEKLGEGQVSPVLKELKEWLPDDSPRWKEVILLEKRQNDANLNRLRGILSDEQLQLAYNRISHDLLTLIESLDESDLDPEQETSDVSVDGKVRQGSILYKIPDHMTLHEESLCIVRVAFQEEQIIKGIDLDQDVKLVQRRVSNIMQAELFDPSDEKPFRIASPNDAEQFVDEDDYTEWLFMVTPLLPGEFPLWLKVAVIEEIRGKERKREVVLREQVNIVAEPSLQREGEAGFKQVPELSLTLGSGAGATATPENEFRGELDHQLPGGTLPPEPTAPLPKRTAKTSGPKGEEVRASPAPRGRRQFLRTARAIAAVTLPLAVGGYLLFNQTLGMKESPPGLENTAPDEDPLLPGPGKPDKQRPIPPRMMEVKVFLEEDWAEATLLVNGKRVGSPEERGVVRSIRLPMTEKPRQFEIRRSDGRACRMTKTITPGDQTVRFSCG